MSAIGKGDTVWLIGLRSFSTDPRTARVGRNPMTGAEIQILAAKAVKFTSLRGPHDAAMDLAFLLLEMLFVAALPCFGW